MGPLRLVTFDVTGTLLNFRSPVMEQYASFAKRHGIFTHPELLHKNFKKSWKTLWAEHPNFGQSSGLGWEQWWHTIVKKTFRDENEGKTTQLAEELVQHFKTDKAWAVVDGAEDILRSLRALKLKIGVISNFDPRLHDILQNMKLHNYFNFVLTSYEAGVAKPDPGIFVKALQLGDISISSEALHIGNDINLDLCGAQKAGLHGLLIGSNDNLTFPQIVTDISEVPKCIEYVTKQNY